MPLPRKVKLMLTKTIRPSIIHVYEVGEFRLVQGDVEAALVKISRA